MITLYMHLILSSVLLSLFLGFYALLINRNSFLNRFFFRLSFIISLLSVTFYFLPRFVSVNTSITLLKTMSFTWFFLPVVFFQFVCSLTIPDDKKVNTGIHVLYVFPALLYVTSLLRDKESTILSSLGSGLVTYRKLNSYPFIISLIFCMVLISASLILLYGWKRKNRGTIREKQAAVIINSTLIISILLLVYRKIFYSLFGTYPPPFLPLFLTFWLSAIAFAIFKYHLLVEVPKIVQDDLLNHVSDLIMILDLDNKIVFVNNQTIAVSGYSFSELRQKHYSYLFKNKILKDDTYMSNIFITKTNTEIPVRISVFSHKNNRGKLIGKIITVVDQRIMMVLQNEIDRKEALMLKHRESEKKFSVIFNSSPVGMLLFDIRSGSIIDVNRKAAIVTGFSHEELKDMSFIINKLLINNKDNRELVHLLITDSPVINRNVIINTKWGLRKILLASFDMVYIAGLKYLLITGSDITESVRLKKQLITTKKLESIGILAGGIAHDFNNMLTIINGNLSLALAELKDPDQREYLEDALEAGRNASSLTSQLLTFSKGKETVFEATDLHEIIKQSVKIALSGKNTSASLYLDAKRYTVLGDRNQLKQVFINLIINSVQALDNIGEITITTTNDRYGNTIVVSVTDFGKGIPESKLFKIFDPFFSTKSKGTGLGLSVVYSTITDHNGTIEAASTKEEGTTFTITLPLQKQPGRSNR